MFSTTLSTVICKFVNKGMVNNVYSFYRFETLKDKFYKSFNAWNENLMKIIYAKFRKMY